MNFANKSKHLNQQQEDFLVKLDAMFNWLQKTAHYKVFHSFHDSLIEANKSIKELTGENEPYMFYTTNAYQSFERNDGLYLHFRTNNLAELERLLNFYKFDYDRLEKGTPLFLKTKERSNINHKHNIQKGFI